MPRMQNRSDDILPDPDGATFRTLPQSRYSASEDKAMAALRNTRPHKSGESLMRSDDKVWIRGPPVVDVVDAGDLCRLVHAKPLEPVQCVEQYQTARMHNQVFKKLIWKGSSMQQITHTFDWRWQGFCNTCASPGRRNGDA